jgi:hypothetical protein
MTAKKHPDLTPVESTALSGLHYDQGSRTLHVQFPKGDVWAYDDVSLERAESLMGAQSKGRYFSDQIKGNHIGRKVT